MIEPDYDSSLSFLERWLPGGPWVLVAIDPRKRALEAATFGGADPGALRRWLEEQGTKLRRNVYFTVNPCSRALSTKPSREHVAALAWLHVDVDPRVGEDFDAERERIRALVEDASHLGLPRPTAVIDSGGGYQAFWRLAKPLLLDGSAAAYEDAKLWNKQLELTLGGDNCHNVDRIMRLPGTVNRPDKRKLAKGRKAVLARLVSFDDSTHDLARFSKAPALQGADAPGFAGQTVEVSGNVARFSSVDEIEELREDRYAKCRVVIVQGNDPDDADKFPGSRSEWLFFACCEMVRAGCSDDAIFSVITDPDFGISESVLDKGSNVESYALRQIERAREEAIDPLLREFNDRHAVIGSIGARGLCRILGEEWDPILGRPRIAFQSQSDFMLRYKKRKVEWVTDDGKPASKPAAVWWLEHPQGRYFDTIVFAPGKSTPGAYNMWKGFAVSADPSGSCELYLRHVRENICCGNDEYFDYLVNWMANAVQNPAQPGQVAVVLRGDQGTGKGVFATGFGSLWGRHFLPVSNAKHLTGSFNAHMRDCVVMYGDEAFGSDDEQAASTLKTLVTESTIVTEAKGVDAEPTPNFIHLILSSNSKWVVPAGDFERRYFVLDVSADRRQDGAYFNAIEEELNDGGREALLAMLLARDLSDFDVRRRPETAGLSDQQERSMGPEDDWWYSKLCDGEVLPGEDWGLHVYCETLLHDYAEHMRANGSRTKVSSNRLRRFLDYATSRLVKKVQLRPATPQVVRHRDGIGREVARPYAFELPSLEECRTLWKSLGKPCNWPEAVGEAEPVYGEAGIDEDGEVIG